MNTLIRNIRFPLCVLIVFMHCNPLVFVEHPDSFPVFSAFQRFFMDSFFRLGVPIFFLMSGYLFFSTADSFSMTVYKDKIKRRFHTLFCPYLTWNIIVLLLYFLGSKLLFPMPAEKAVTDYSISDVFWSIWHIGHVYGNDSALVIDTPLWFVRDLMVMSLLTPVLYSLMKKVHFLLLVPFALLWITEYAPQWYAPGDQSLFFFSLGVFLGIRKFEIPEQLGRCGYVMLVTYCLLSLVLFNSDFCSVKWMRHVLDLYGIVSVLSVASYLTHERGEWKCATLASSSFFLYAFFQLPLVFLQKIGARFLESELSVFVLFFVASTAVILIGWSGYTIVKRYSPSTLCRLLTGGR